MATNERYTVKYRRARIQKTDYRSRLRLLLSRKNRLVIRKSLNRIYLQIVNYNKNGDKVLLAVNSEKLKKYGWLYKTSNSPACYLTGLLFGLDAKKHDINEAILDLGLNPSVKGSNLYAALKGIVDSGLKIPYDKKILPDDIRIKGEHIKKYALLLKNKDEKYEKQFSKYLKNKVYPDNIVENFESVKKKIISEYENEARR